MKLQLKKQWVWLIALFVIAILLRLPALQLPIDNDAGARAYYARRILAGEPLYSSHHTGHHLPAIHYTFATAFTLFGDQTQSIQLFLLLWTLVTLYCLYRLAVEVTESEAVGLLAVLFYAVLSAHVQLWGQTPETELFANLPRITAVWLLIVLLKREKAAWCFAGVGLLGAVAFLYKATYLSPLLLAALSLLIIGWQKRGKRDSWPWLWRRAAWLGTGFGAGLLPVALYFASLGLWQRLLLIFTLGQSYVADSPLNPEVATGIVRWLLYPLLPLFGLGINNAALLILSLLGGYIILRQTALRHSPLLWLLLWYLLSFAEAGINLELFTHYYLLIVPPLAILAAWVLIKLHDELQAAKGGKAAKVLLAGLLLLVLGISGWENGRYYTQYVRYATGQSTLDQFVEQGWPAFGPRLTRAARLADYVAAHTEANDQLYIWSEDVQVYYLANRQPPIDMIWPIDIGATGPPERIFTAQTRMIIVDHRRDPPPPDWFLAKLAESYTLEAQFEEQSIFRHVE